MEMTEMEKFAEKRASEKIQYTKYIKKIKTYPKVSIRNSSESQYSARGIYYNFRVVQINSHS